jgi:hypothetical protein
MQNYNSQTNGTGFNNTTYGLESEQGLSNQQMDRMMASQPVYPEVFYKLQPYIMMACDQMDPMGEAMPSQEMVDQMSDNINNEFVQAHPDLAEYVRENENMPRGEAADLPVINFFPGRFYGGPRFFGRPFRRRGVFRDLIGTLLLSELFRRRRGRRYWY